MATITTDGSSDLEKSTSKDLAIPNLRLQHVDDIKEEEGNAVQTVRSGSFHFAVCLPPLLAIVLTLFSLCSGARGGSLVRRPNQH